MFILVGSQVFLCQLQNVYQHFPQMALKILSKCSFLAKSPSHKFWLITNAHSYEDPFLVNTFELTIKINSKVLCHGYDCQEKIEIAGELELSLACEEWQSKWGNNLYYNTSAQFH